MHSRRKKRSAESFSDVVLRVTGSEETSICDYLRTLNPAVVYARIAHTLSGTGRHISSFDELTAAIALRNNEPPLSRYQPFAAIEGLNVITC